MASEYLKWKYRDTKPAEKPADLTGRAKWANWWHYHKWHVLAALALVLGVGDFLWHVLGIGVVEPDYQFAYVGKELLAEDAVAALQDALAPLGQDCNGDGRTVVQLNQYATGGAGSPDYAYASYTRLMVDLDNSASYFFLLDDPAAFQRDYQVLRPLDGSMPDEPGPAGGDLALAWADCPVLTGLDLEAAGADGDVFPGLYLARRGFWSGKTAAFPEECDLLWDRLTAGAAAK